MSVSMNRSHAQISALVGSAFLAYAQTAPVPIPRIVQKDGRMRSWWTALHS